MEAVAGTFSIVAADLSAGEVGCALQSRCVESAGQIVGDGFVVRGNMLVGSKVVA
jgi:uncharacterized Ntn-hydrolase superfamily protein